MKKIGLISSGGGLRTFANVGVYHSILSSDKVEIKHVIASSGGVGASLGALVSTPEDLESQMRSFSEGKSQYLDYKVYSFDVFSNWSYFIKINCPFNSLKEEEILAHYTPIMEKVKFDVSVTELKKGGENGNLLVNFNQLFLENRLDEIKKYWNASSTILPQIKAEKLGESYLIDGGYSRNSPVSELFSNPEIDEIYVIDFGIVDYFSKLDSIYSKNFPVQYMCNYLEVKNLTEDLQFTLPNRVDIKTSLMINEIVLQKGENGVLELNDKTYYYKPIKLIKLDNLDSNILNLNGRSLLYQYFELGKEKMNEFLLEEE